MTDGARDAIGGVLRFAREELGPESERVLGAPEAQALVLSRMRAGAELEDAVLWIVHREARSDARVADEFVGYFLAELLDTARPAIAPRLRRFLDTGDLVQSVLGDVWSELSQLSFDRRSQFLALITQRLSWKASDHARKLSGARRREDLRSEESELEPASPERSPESLAAVHDEWERLTLAILRLSERDRLLVRMHLRGESIEAIMSATQLDYEAARKAVQRAVRRARDAAG